MSIGVWQVVIILVIVLIIFGAGKLPHVMGDVAKGIKNFKKGMAEDESESKSKKSIEDSETAEAPVTAKAEKTEAENKQS
jgi:sec-independent protein translocase protein TatA